MSNLYMPLEQYRTMRKNETYANFLPMARKLLSPEDLKVIEAEEKVALPPTPQTPATPALEEILLHESDSNVLGLDSLDEDNARLMDAITETKRARTLAPADSMPPLAEAIARKFVGLGGHVIFFPRGTKRCTVPGWEQRATNNLEEALKWAQEDPHANVGLVGKPDGLWILDDDSGIVAAEYESKHGKIPTYTVYTVSGGKHYIFRQNDLSRAMGNVNLTDANKSELMSARVVNRYVVAAGSWAYPNNDTTQPLKMYMAEDPSAPIIEAPATLIEFIQKRAGSKPKALQGQAAVADAAMKAAVVTEIREGGRNNFLTSQAGIMRQKFSWVASKIEQELLLLNEQKCKPPLSPNEVKTIADSIGRYPVQPGDMVSNITPDAMQDSEPEIEDCQIAKYPEFPRWVMAGTSLYEGLAKPAAATSDKYEELIWVPAVQLMLNAVALHVRLAHTPSIVPNMFVGVIAPYGQYFKSSCCELGHQYFQSMGLIRKNSRDLKQADVRTVIFSVGSTEGLGKQMSRMNAKKALLYFDELGKFISKAGIENSSFSDDMLSFYESGDFGNLTKNLKDSYQFDAKTYCISWQWCTTDRTFPRLWSKLANVSTGLNDRMFFLLAPEKPKNAGMFEETDFSAGAKETLTLFNKAVAQGKYDYEDIEYAKDRFQGLDARGLAAAERFALYFAIDLGLPGIDSECVDRARALADYRRETLAYLDPIEAETMQGKNQQQITRELLRHGGKMPFRELYRKLHGERWGTGMWDSAYCGLLAHYIIGEREAKAGKGAEQRPKMVYLLKQRD